MSDDAARQRRILSHFATGVVVVTAIADTGEPVGLTCQSFSSLSLEPPLVMFAVARSSTSWPRVRAVGRFAVSILGEHQEHISRRFSVHGADKFAGVGWRPGRFGAPLLDGALAYVEAHLAAVYDGGDHEIVVGRVLDLAEVDADGHPLLFFRSEYRSLSWPAAWSDHPAS
jgi:flavin reductase (DIM6/NTAB) family NADH-FMN oxidoreductase RutF